MATYEITAPDGKVFEITAPDNASEAEVLAYAQKNFNAAPAQPQQPQGRTFPQELARQGGRFARMGIEGVTGMGVSLMDASDAIAKLTGLVPHSQPTPSSKFQKSLDALGLPKNEGPIDAVTGFLGSAAAGAFDPISKAMQAATAAKNVPKAFQTAKQTEHIQAREAAKELRKAGIAIAPKQARDRALPQAIETVSRSGQLQKELQAENVEPLRKLAEKANKLPANTLSRDVLEAQANKLAEEGYEPIARLSRIPVGKLYRDDLRKIVRELADNRSFPLAQRDAVGEEVVKYMSDGQRYIQSFTGRDAIKSIKQLRQEADALYSSETGDKVLAKTKKMIADALEDQIERSLQGTKLLDNFRSTRTQLAKNYATRRMLADPVTGTIDPAKAHAAWHSGEKLTGELQTIAKAGSPLFQSSTRPPAGGDPGAFDRWDLSMMGGGAAASLFNPGFGMVVGLPVAAAGARKALQSGPVQNYLSKDPIPADVKQRLLMGGMNQMQQYRSLFDPYHDPYAQ